MAVSFEKDKPYAAHAEAHWWGGSAALTPSLPLNLEKAALRSTYVIVGKAAAPQRSDAVRGKLSVDSISRRGSAGKRSCRAALRCLAPMWRVSPRLPAP